MMRRREVITLLGGAAAWPVVARAQQPALPVIGFLNGSDPETNSHLAAAFREGLTSTGYVEGRNVVIEYRWAENHYDRLPALAADLVRRQVAVIFAGGGGGVAPQAAKAATATIPIVFTGGFDPVRAGLVTSLNRPGANVTGVSFLVNELGTKRLGLLREMVPTATMIAFLVDPTNPNAEPETIDVRDAANALGHKLLVARASTASEIDTAFASLVEQRAEALVVAGEILFLSRRAQLSALAARHSLPAIYHLREIAVAGGLMSYGTSIGDAFRQAGVYTGRILKGEPPRELPVLRPTKFELIINRTTAKALGLNVPPTLLAIADEVIE